MSERDHERIVDLLGSTHEQRLLRSLKDLEERLATLVIQAPESEGKLADTAWALKARADIQQIFRETFLTEADVNIRDYSQITESMSELFAEYNEVFGVTNDVIGQLQSVSFQGFQDIASTFADELANELYQNTLVGRPRDEAVRNIRQKINGVYMTSDQDEINRLVAIVEAGGEDAEEALETLHRTYAADRLGRNMRRYASQMVYDSITQFDSALAVTAGREIGATRWKYYGGVVQDSRDWCIAHVNKTYTEDEIRQEWDENVWTGKAAGDPFIVRGGHNCRHLWRPAFKLDFSDDDAPAPKPKKPQALLGKSSFYSTSKGVEVDGMNKIIAAIPDIGDRGDKLAEFMQKRDMRVLALKQTEMNRKTAANAKIQYGVTQFLASGADKATAEKANMYGSGYFALRSTAKSCNGYTADSWEHVVIKSKTGANFKKLDHAQSAAKIKDRVGAALTGDRMEWSMSYVQETVEEQMTVTMIHEIGHQIHFWAGNPKKPQWAFSGTKYAKTNDYEFHAENFAAWFFNRDALNQSDPRLATYFDDLMEKALTNRTKTGRGI